MDKKNYNTITVTETDNIRERGRMQKERWKQAKTRVKMSEGTNKASKSEQWQ